jgi:hypothetical protein
MPPVQSQTNDNHIHYCRLENTFLTKIETERNKTFPSSAPTDTATTEHIITTDRESHRSVYRNTQTVTREETDSDANNDSLVVSARKLLHFTSPFQSSSDAHGTHEYGAAATAKATMNATVG